MFGGLLLIQQVFPQSQPLGSVVVLAIGLAFLVKWAIDRGTGSLYAGAIITALAVPGLLNAAGIEADGLSTFSFGIAFLFIAAVRAFVGRRRSAGSSGSVACWRCSAAVNIASASFGGYIVPIVLVALGLLLIAARWRPRRTRPLASRGVGDDRARRSPRAGAA